MRHRPAQCACPDRGGHRDRIGYHTSIIAVEKIFNYNGMGATMLFAAQNKDLPMLTAGVLIIGIVYMVATLALTSSWPG
jgi:ABC-type antimicrobial peptide transport system permease subunit